MLDFIGVGSEHIVAAVDDVGDDVGDDGRAVTSCEQWERFSRHLPMLQLLPSIGSHNKPATAMLQRRILVLGNYGNYNSATEEWAFW